MKRMLLVLGHPIYAVSFTLLVFLIGSGAGCLAAARLSPTRPRLGGWIAVVVLLGLAAGLRPARPVGQVTRSAARGEIRRGVLRDVSPGLRPGNPLPSAWRSSGRRPGRSCRGLVRQRLRERVATLGALLLAMNFGYTATLCVGSGAYVAALAPSPACAESPFREGGDAMSLRARLCLGACLVLALGSCRPGPAKPGRVTGTVLRRGAACHGRSWQAYPKADQEPGRTPPVAETPTGTEGPSSCRCLRTVLDLGQGDHRGERARSSAGGRGDSQPGGDPARSGSHREDRALRPSGFTSASRGGIGGRGARPAPAGERSARRVYVYPTARRARSARVHRGRRADAEGRFKVNLRPGAYVLAVRQRRSGGTTAPGRMTGCNQPGAGGAGEYARPADLSLAPIDPKRWATVTRRWGRPRPAWRGRFSTRRTTRWKGSACWPSGIPG